MYINIFGSSDRLGGNIGDIVAQILYAMHKKIYIHYERRDYIRVYNSYNQDYNRTIFIQTLFDIIDKYNTSIKDKDLRNEIDLASPTHFETFTRTLLELKKDLFSAFKKIYTPDIRKSFMKRAEANGYTIPFDPEKTILIHLRLEDVKNKPDYDGRLCANYFKEKIESGHIVDHTTNEEVLKLNQNCSVQAPIPFKRIQDIVERVKKSKPGHEVIIITNPGEDLNGIPYRCISSLDESYDLFLLCNCETLILSKSNFALSSLFFGIAKEVYIPLWSVVPCYGLYTSFDSSNFQYFI